VFSTDPTHPRRYLTTLGVGRDPHDLEKLTDEPERPKAERIAVIAI
jgi:hypothetical protein